MKEDDDKGLKGFAIWRSFLAIIGKYQKEMYESLYFF